MQAAQAIRQRRSVSAAHGPALCWILLAGSAVSAQIPDQYPKPLVHTPTDHPAARAILIAVDGLHAYDLANWVSTHPNSAFAELSARGVTYTNAHVPWADPAAGLASLITGGTPISTGIVSSDGYDRSLSPPGSKCLTRGSVLAIDASELPLDPRTGCKPVQPHALLRVNTMFEVVHEKVGPTAWAGESAWATDLLRGPSAKGLDDACTFAPLDRSVEAAAEADAKRWAALLHWIDAKDCTGARDAAVPVLFGISVGCFARAQSTPGLGYADAVGALSTGMAKCMEAIDSQLALVIAELKQRKLYDSTWIFIAAPYGQARVDQTRRRLIPLAQLRSVAESVRPGATLQLSGGDIAMVWLSDPALTPKVVSAFEKNAAALGIDQIYFGERLALTLNRPDKDPRMPNIVLQPDPEVIWSTTGDVRIASYGGMSDDDTHVAMLVSGAQLTGRYDPTWVPATQLPPLLLRALGMEKFDLRALHLEHSPALPGIF